MKAIRILGASAALAAAALSGIAPAVAEPTRPTAREAPAPTQSRDVTGAAEVERRRQQRYAEAERGARWLRRLNRPRYPKPGYSVRQGQRMARKARNRARHKARSK